jgi:uncharacterized protein YvpB
MRKLRNYALIVMVFFISFTIFFIIKKDSYADDLSNKDVVIKEGLPKVSALSLGESNGNINHKLSVPFIQQMPELPRGCEVTSLAILLQYEGVQVSKLELAEKIDKVPFEENGLKGDMNEGFLGDMYSFKTPGLGVYVNPIIKLANLYLPGRIVNLSDKPINDLYKMIDKGSPVWVITNAKFKKLPESEFRIFNTKNGPMKVTYQEHSVIITGYDEEYVYINNPLAQEPNTPVNRKDFEEAWVQMGSQAMGINPSKLR